MRFTLNEEMIDAARTALANRPLYWLLGGAGAGKTTIGRYLAERFEMPLIDMDARIYGSWRSAFSESHHPVNAAWASAPNGLAWLLDMSWERFDGFHRAAAGEYLSLLAGELAGTPPELPMLIDGGVWHPDVLVQVFPPHRLVALAGPETASAAVWSGERAAMRAMFASFSDPEAAWAKFLSFDEGITRTISAECRRHGIPVLARRAGESVEQVGDRAAAAFGIGLP